MLTRADLSNARLGPLEVAEGRYIRADLSRATLRGARLDGADLTRARLIEADLDLASFDGARLSQVEFDPGADPELAARASAA